jgi:hypothetical protein
MRMVEEFSLDPLKVAPGRAAYEDRRSRLLRHGRDTGTVVPGAVLEAQIALDQGWLLFTTHDIPFEEGLDITLLDGSCKVIDGAALFGAYTTGTFRNLVLASEDTIVFDFFSAHRWRVTLFGRPQFRLPLPWIVEPIGVHRTFGFTRRFAVSAFGQAA